MSDDNDSDDGDDLIFDVAVFLATTDISEVGSVIEHWHKGCLKCFSVDHTQEFQCA